MGNNRTLQNLGQIGPSILLGCGSIHKDIHTDRDYKLSVYKLSIEAVGRGISGSP